MHRYVVLTRPRRKSAACGVAVGREPLGRAGSCDSREGARPPQVMSVTGREPAADGERAATRASRPGGGGRMVAWIASFIGGVIGLGCYWLYLCRGPRRRGPTAQEVEELRVLAAIELDEDPL